MITLFDIKPLKKHTSGNKNDFIVKTFDELEECLKKYQKEEKIFRTTFIVFLRKKYDWEKEWHYINSLLTYDVNNNCWLWEWDWNEGQQDIEYLGFLDLEEITENIENKFKEFME